MRLVLERSALGDLDAIAAWIGARSPRGAERVMRCIERTIAALEHFPESGRQMRRRNAHVLLEPKYRYRIIYQIDHAAETVRVLNIIHPARRLR